MLKNLQTKLEDINQKLLPVHRSLLWALPIILFFSYYPVIPLFSTESSNYEFSLPLLWLLLMGILSLPIFFADLCNLITKKTPLTKVPVQIPLILSSIPLYFSLTLLWSSNKFRGLMTAGIIWCLYLSLLTFYKNIILKKIPLSLEKPFLLGATLASGFCWLQAILNTLNIPGDQILLCLGCTNLSFGFPHPNGFAIEPQFMGNLLLAPAIFLVFRAIHPQNQNPLPHTSWVYYFNTFLDFFKGRNLFLLPVCRGDFSLWSISRQKETPCRLESHLAGLIPSNFRYACSRFNVRIRPHLWYVYGWS